MTIVKAYLIDPVLKQVTEIDHDDSDFRNISRTILCRTFTCVGYGEDVIYVDDEGLYAPDQSYFKLDHYHQNLGGRGLMFGMMDDDHAEKPHMPLELFRSQVSFPNVECVGLVPTSGTTTFFGEEMQYIGSVPVFEEKKR
jgi:hypothetical protein